MANNEQLQDLVNSLQKSVKQQQEDRKERTNFNSLSEALQGIGQQTTQEEAEPTEGLVFEENIQDSEVFKIITDVELTKQERTQNLIEHLKSQLESGDDLQDSLAVLQKITSVFQKKISVYSNKQTDLQVAAAKAKQSTDSLNVHDALRELTSERQSILDQLDVIDDFRVQEDGVAKMIEIFLTADAQKAAKRKHDETLGKIKKDISKTSSKVSELKDKIERIEGVSEDGEVVVTGELQLAKNELATQQGKWLKRQSAIQAAQSRVTSLESELLKAKTELKTTATKETSLRSELAEQQSVYESFMKEYNQMRHIRSLLENDGDYEEELASIRTKGREISGSIQKRYDRICDSNSHLLEEAKLMHESNEMMMEYVEIIVGTLNELPDFIKEKVDALHIDPNGADAANDNVLQGIAEIRNEEARNVYNAHLAHIEILQEMFTNHFRAVVEMHTMIQQHRTSVNRENQRLMSMQHDVTTTIDQGVRFLVSRLSSKALAAEMMSLLAHTKQVKDMNKEDMEDALKGEILLELQQTQQYQAAIEAIENQREALQEFAKLDKQIGGVKKTLQKGVRESAHGLAKDAQIAFGYKGDESDEEVSDAPKEATPATPSKPKAPKVKPA